MSLCNAPAPIGSTTAFCATINKDEKKLLCRLLSNSRVNCHALRTVSLIPRALGAARVLEGDGATVGLFRTRAFVAVVHRETRFVGIGVARRCAGVGSGAGGQNDGNRRHCGAVVESHAANATAQRDGFLGGQKLRHDGGVCKVNECVATGRKDANVLRRHPRLAGKDGLEVVFGVRMIVGQGDKQGVLLVRPGQTVVRKHRLAIVVRGRGDVLEVALGNDAPLVRALDQQDPNGLFRGVHHVSAHAQQLRARPARDLDEVAVRKLHCCCVFWVATIRSCAAVMKEEQKTQCGVSSRLCSDGVSLPGENRCRGAQLSRPDHGFPPKRVLPRPLHRVPRRPFWHIGATTYQTLDSSARCFAFRLFWQCGLLSSSIKKKRGEK